jgi:hypothetical protein
LANKNALKFSAFSEVKARGDFENALLRFCIGRGILTIDIREYWPALPALFWSSSYAASHCLAVAPQSAATQIFYCTFYYIILNSNCEAQRAPIKLRKIVEDRVRSQKLSMSD